MKIIINNDLDVQVLLSPNTNISTNAADLEALSNVDEAAPEDTNEELELQEQVDSDEVKEIEGEQELSDEIILQDTTLDGEEYYHEEVGVKDMPIDIPAPKKGPMASLVFLIVITVVVLGAGIGSGILLGRRKIKKGLDIDEID